MLYHRGGGVFRGPFIAVPSQRAQQILSRPSIVQTALDFDAGTAEVVTTYANNEIVPLALTVELAIGQERLVIVAGLSNDANADFDACTIDGQVATRVGTVSRGTGSGARGFVTAYRAPGTVNTSITVGLTVQTIGGNFMLASYAACWKMSNAGTVQAQTSAAANDPTLSVNVTAKGAIAGGVIGYGPSAPFVGATDAFAWTGLTDRYENTVAPNVAFSAASADIAAGETPRVVSVDITPDLISADQTTASLTLSFNPVATGSVPALAGAYVLSGTDTTPKIGRFAVADPGSHTLTGTDATPRLGRVVAAVGGVYTLTGTDATPGRSAGATASIAFDAAIADPANVAPGDAYTFPLTVAASTGERLVIIGGIGRATEGDFTACTIDGETATRVGFLSRGQSDLAYASYLTAYRAPGTASTSINVVATVGPATNDQLSGYCACFHMSGAGELFASTNNNLNDPVLSTDTVNNGAVVAALLGYQDVTVPSVAWSGLTECFDGVNAAGVEVFSGAIADVSSGALPRVISADITPNLATVNDDSVASICLSFLPSGAASNTLAGNPGTYVLSGLDATTRRGFRTAAIAGSYTITGMPATLQTSGRVIAEPASYTITGSAVATLRGGTNKLVDATLPGSYAITGTETGTRKGRRLIATTVGSYAITGTTVASGKGLIALPGAYAITGLAASLSKTTASGASVSISVSAAPLTASTGTVTVSGGTGAGISLTGNQITASAGDVTVIAAGRVDVLVPVSAPNLASIPIFVGTVTVSVVGGTQEVEVSGTEMTASVGDVEVTIPGQTEIDILDRMIMGLGTVTVNVPGSVNVLLFGNELTAHMGVFDEGGFGDGTITTVANVEVEGEQMLAEVGTVESTSPVTVFLNTTGISGTGMTASVGTVTVTAKQHVSVTVTGNSMVVYVGRLRFVGGGTVVYLADQVREGQMLRPSNWMGG